MSTLANALRYAAFGLMMLFGLAAGAFIAGEAVTEPGGWRAVWMTALWLVPLVVTGAYALRRPGPASRVLAVLTAAVGLFVVLDATVGLVDKDVLGPVPTVMVFALAMPLACLGLHRPRLGGLLLLATGGLQVLTVLGGLAAHTAGVGPSRGQVLVSSSMAVAMPVVVVGALFLLAALLDPRREGTGRPSRSGRVGLLRHVRPARLQPGHRHPER